MIKIYMDGGTLEQMRKCDRSVVSGFTTNPSLMRKLGVVDYQAFATEALEIAGDLPVSIEVFADDLKNMGRQARVIADWGDNAVVKIPITTTGGESTAKIVERLVHEGVNVNVTAVFMYDQAVNLIDVVGKNNNQVIISVFAGRIADTGIDPEVEMLAIRESIGHHLLLWASTREVLNYVHAKRSGCDIITMTTEQIDKMVQLNKRDLRIYSRETVQMFYDDATKAGYKI